MNSLIGKIKKTNSKIMICAHSNPERTSFKLIIWNSPIGGLVEQASNKKINKTRRCDYKKEINHLISYQTKKIRPVTNLK